MGKGKLWGVRQEGAFFSLCFWRLFGCLSLLAYQQAHLSRRETVKAGEREGERKRETENEAEFTVELHRCCYAYSAGCFDIYRNPFH